MKKVFEDMTLERIPLAGNDIITSSPFAGNGVYDDETENPWEDLTGKDKVQTGNDLY